MKTKNFIFVVLALIGLNSTMIAQQKYALLIGGNYLPGTEIPVEHRWNNGQDMDPVKGYDEFWNDTFLMWELLHDDTYGYSNDNINVLFGGGVDYSFPLQDGRYKSITYHQDIPFITDGAATKTNVMSALLGFSTLTENDYLFIWIMSNGGNTVPPPANTTSDSYIYLWGYNPADPNAGRLYDYELKEKLDAIPYVKKVVVIQAPNSGGFAAKLAGTNTIVLTSSHQFEPAGRADNTPFTENETWGTNVYYHGEFGFHLYSSLYGESPAGNTSYGTENFNLANIYEDDVISFDEAFNFWLLGHHSTTEEPIYSDAGIHGDISSVHFATLINKNINANKNVTGIVGVTAIQEEYADVVITAGITSFENARVCFVDNVRLVSWGGILDVGENVVMTGNRPDSYLYILTGINFTQGNLFTGHEGVRWGGIAAQGVSLYMDEVTFIDCHLFLDAIPSLSVSQSLFLRSGINGKRMERVNIYNNNYFTNSFCQLIGIKGKSVLVIDDAHFSGPVINYEPNRAIYISTFNNYQIVNSIIQDYSDGIMFSFCNTLPHLDYIKNNSIHNNSNYGILLLNSSSEIQDNVGIYENKTGILCYDYSNIKIKGNMNAVHISETQKIHNNDLYQIYSTYNSFPLLEWNAIWSDDNTNCLVKVEPITGTTLKNITNNFWGPPALFNPNVDFCPNPAANYFNWIPVWNLQYGPPPKTSDELLYSSAMQNIEQESYFEAESDLKELISGYPTSDFADNALMELLPLASFLGENHYDLKEYYQSDSTVLNNDHLSQVGDFLTAWCDAELENFPESIEYFENTIDNPPSFQDSIFAIIDLSYIYLLMGENNKSSYTGKYAQYKFKSFEEYNTNTDYLLSLIGDDDNIPDSFKQSISLLKTGELLQNIPNPFSGSSQIWYKLDVESSVIIKIFDYTGKLIETFNQGSQVEGPHNIEFSAANLPSGIYFYSLEVNGIKTDTKKMTLMK